MEHFFPHKRATKTKFAAQLFFRFFFRILYNLQEAGKTRENLKYFEKKVSVSEKKVSALIPIPKLDLSFGSRYPNLILVVHQINALTFLSLMPYSSILVSKLFWTRPRTFGLDQQLFGSKGKFSYYVLIVLNKVAQQFQILLFIDNSIANISLYALSRLYLNLGRLSDLGINFLCTQTREFCLLLDANCKF